MKLTNFLFLAATLLFAWGFSSYPILRLFIDNNQKALDVGMAFLFPCLVFGFACLFWGLARASEDK